MARKRSRYHLRQGRQILVYTLELFETEIEVNLMKIESSVRITAKYRTLNVKCKSLVEN
jgi:hypothetical protein